MPVEFRSWRLAAIQEAKTLYTVVLGQIDQQNKQIRALEAQISQGQKDIPQLQQRAEGLDTFAQRLRDEPLDNLILEGNRPRSLADFVRTALDRYLSSLGKNDAKQALSLFGQLLALENQAREIGFNPLKKIQPISFKQSTDPLAERLVKQDGEWLIPTGRTRGPDLELSLGSIGPFFATPNEIKLLHLLLTHTPHPVSKQTMLTMFNIENPANIRKGVMRLRRKIDTLPPTVLTHIPYEGYTLNLEAIQRPEEPLEPQY